jgi:outer membrane protein assembly factor BamB
MTGKSPRIHVFYWAIFLLAISTAGQAVDAADEWNQFRGPSGMGHGGAPSLPTEWSEEKNVVWKTEIPGTGWSSPVVSGDQIWMTTSTIEEATPEEVKEASKGKPFPVALAHNLKMYAICVDQASGDIVHQRLLMEEPAPDVIHTMNSYASPTPVIGHGHVYCHFGTNGTACIDTDSGEIVWENRDLHLDHSTGAGSSPILWNDRLIVNCDGIDVQYIAALNTSDGSFAWKTPRSGELNEIPEFKKAFSTPIILTAGGQEVVISAAADWVYGYDPQTGEELWKVSYQELGFSTTPCPVFGDGKLYICTGFMKSRLLAMDFDAEDRSVAPQLLWEFGKQVPTITSPLWVAGSVYFVSEQGGVLTSVDGDSGEMQWKKRLGGNYAASPIYANGHVYVFSREGMTTVFQPADEFKEVAKNELEGSFMASPAITGNALILRTDRALYRIEKKN